jgi:hypothetical protein
MPAHKLCTRWNGGNDTMDWQYIYEPGTSLLEPRRVQGEPGFVAGLTDVPNSGPNTVGFVPAQVCQAHTPSLLTLGAIHSELSLSRDPFAESFLSLTISLAGCAALANMVGGGGAVRRVACVLRRAYYARYAPHGFGLLALLFSYAELLSLFVLTQWCSFVYTQTAPSLARLVARLRSLCSRK